MASTSWIRSFAAVIFLATSVGACSASDSDTSTDVGSATSVVADQTSSSTAATVAPVDLAALPSVADVAALAGLLSAGGLPCTLSYEGIKDDSGLDRVVSICTVSDEQAYLYLWNDPTELADFAADPGTVGSPVVVGAIWSISTGTLDVAAQVATATGGAPLF
jgi:hypothetical protein